MQSSRGAQPQLGLKALETQQKEKGNKHGSTGSRRQADRIRAAPPFLVERVGGVEGGGGVLERVVTYVLTVGGV